MGLLLRGGGRHGLLGEGSLGKSLGGHGSTGSIFLIGFGGAEK